MLRRLLPSSSSSPVWLKAAWSLSLVAVVVGSFGLMAAAWARGDRQISQARATLRLQHAKGLRLSVRGLAAGDVVQRTVDVRNVGALRSGRMTLQLRLRRKVRRSLLVTDRVQGLRVRVDRCSARWRYDRPTRTYVCKRHRVTVLMPRPVLGGALRLRKMPRLRPHSVVYLRLTVGLPVTAGNTVEGLRTTLVYRFSAPSGTR
jgi:hypothetical protein